MRLVKIVYKMNLTFINNLLFSTTGSKMYF